MNLYSAANRPSFRRVDRAAGPPCGSSAGMAVVAEITDWRLPGATRESPLAVADVNHPLAAHG